MGRFNHIEAVRQVIDVDGTFTRTWYIEQAPHLRLRILGNSNTITLAFPTNFTAQYGQMCWVSTDQVTPPDDPVSIVWPTGFFMFSSSGDAVPTLGNDSNTLWTGIYTGFGASARFYMTKTAYPLGGFRP